MFTKFAHSGPKIMPHIIAIARKIFVKKKEKQRKKTLFNSYLHASDK